MDKDAASDILVHFIQIPNSMFMKLANSLSQHRSADVLSTVFLSCASKIGSLSSIRVGLENTARLFRSHYFGDSEWLRVACKHWVISVIFAHQDPAIQTMALCILEDFVDSGAPSVLQLCEIRIKLTEVFFRFLFDEEGNGEDRSFQMAYHICKRICILFIYSILTSLFSIQNM